MAATKTPNAIRPAKRMKKSGPSPSSAATNVAPTMLRTPEAAADEPRRDLRPALGGTEQRSQADDEREQAENETKAGDVVTPEVALSVSREGGACLGDGRVIGKRLALQSHGSYGEQDDPREPEDPGYAPPRRGCGGEGRCCGAQMTSLLRRSLIRVSRGI